MRWNCPHCGVALAIADEKLGTSWSFSRCYKCAGHALVRRPEVNVIKVDQAPMGERVVLPETSEEPLLSQQALKHLESARATAESARAAAEKARAGINQAKPIVKPGSRLEARGLSVPPPLPEMPATKRRLRLLPFLAGLTGLIAIGSGAYLYHQGQELWRTARGTLDHAQQAPAKISTQVEQPATRPAPRQVRAEAAGTSEIVTAAAHVSVPANVAPREIVDRVSSNAMAPTREPVLLVEAQVKNASLRAGPGLNYRVIGHATPATRYQVTEWNKSWFKVLLPSGDKTKGSESSAWIRNDLVRLISR